MTEKQVVEMLRYRLGNGEYVAIAAKEAATSRANSKQMYADMTAAVNNCDSRNTFTYTVLQVKTKLNNIRRDYMKFRERIDRSGEENVWRKTKQPFWWADAEALWGTRDATMPGIVLEAGLGVKVEKEGTRAASLPADGGDSDGEDDTPALQPPKARDEDVERRKTAAEMRASRKAEKKTAALKEQAAVLSEAQRETTNELLKGFGQMFAGITAQLARAVDAQVQLQEKLLAAEKKRKRKRSNASVRSSPSGDSSD